MKNWLRIAVAVLGGMAWGFQPPTAQAEEESKSYDLVVIGGTPAGMACAVRAAREGMDVLLVNRHQHLGGILTSGLGVWDTLWEGKRSPIYDEVRGAFFDYYRSTYGKESPQYRDALPGQSGHTNGRYEPHVAEKVFDALVAREKHITVRKGLFPVAVEREKGLLKSLTLRAAEGGGELTVRARVFADCTYEGDLAALAKVPYRVGREARTEYDEPHAGIIFMQPVSEPPTPAATQMAALHDALKLRKFPGWQEVLPQSTGAADDAVQACNYRTMLTTDPANRVPIPKPAHYAPYLLKALEVFSGVESIPNGKFGWNRPQLIGQQTGYVEADPAARQRIMDEHWEMTLGLLYFLQNDPTVPEGVRHAWLEYGLARDEFADNGHRPYEMYIREARRIVGRAVFTEHDATLAPGLARAPVHADSIAMTEWYVDTHSCTTARAPGGMDEGKMMLEQETFPGQIPYRCLLPQDVDNLLVPICLSATHVGWGTVRLEPVFMQTGEAAGLAAALALQNKTTPAQLDPDQLIRALCERRSMVAFFNDVDVSDHASGIAAAEYFGTKGFFDDYNARLNEGLKSTTGQAWAAGFVHLLKGELVPNTVAHAVSEAARSGGKDLTQGEFAALLPASPKTLPSQPEAVISRAAALEWMFSLLASHPPVKVAAMIEPSWPKPQITAPTTGRFEVRVPAPGPAAFADQVMQDAIDAVAAAGGGVVELGAGDFKLSRHAGDETIVLKSGVTLRGQGYATHIYLDPTTPPNAARYYPVRIGTETTASSNVVVENLRYTGNNAKIGGGSIMGFNARLGAPEARLLSSNNVTIRHCWIYDAQQAAGCAKEDPWAYPTPERLAAQSRNWQVYNNYLETCGNKMVEFCEVNGGLIADNYIFDAREGPQVIFGSRNVVIRDNEVYYTESGINISEGSNHIRVSGNHAEPMPTIRPQTVGIALTFRTEPAPNHSTISDIIVTGNTFRNQTTTAKCTVRFQTRKEVLSCSFEGITFTGNIFDGDVHFLDKTTPAHTTLKDILFADNICEGDILSVPHSTMASSHVVVRGNMLRKAGDYTLNANDWIWSGNTHTGGTLQVAAGATGSVVHDNVTTAPIADTGAATNLSGNVVIKKTLP